MGKALEGHLCSRAHLPCHRRQGLRMQSVSQARAASAHKYSVRKSGEAVCPNHGSVRTARKMLLPDMADRNGSNEGQRRARRVHDAEDVESQAAPGGRDPATRRMVPVSAGHKWHEGTPPGAPGPGRNQQDSAHRKSYSKETRQVCHGDHRDVTPELCEYWGGKAGTSQRDTCQPVSPAARSRGHKSHPRPCE